jgi:hypothetical protein
MYKMCVQYSSFEFLVPTVSDMKKKPSDFRYIIVEIEMVSS